MGLCRLRIAVVLTMSLFLLTDSRKEKEEEAVFWENSSRQTLSCVLNRNRDMNMKPAKNVILFIGDGMGLSTITAGRIFMGQTNGQSGEETITPIDNFHHIGLAKVYSIDKQTPDSASTATALLTGIKTKNKIIGLNGKAIFKNCLSSIGNKVKSILEDSVEKSKSTGIVTTTQVQHATPAAAYAHTPSRGWYADVSMDKKSLSHGCKDIALQLLEKGRQMNVILGGGRANMRPSEAVDEEYGSQQPGKRKDNRDLIAEWQNLSPKHQAKYVWNLTDFNAVDAKETDYLLGLFQPNEMRYDHDRGNDVGGEPSLQQMTDKAIKILEKNKKGYFLLVEGGKIDHAHHANQANIALREYSAFNQAIQVAVNNTDAEHTLIVVTADHGHVFTIGGYSDRGNPVFGFARSNYNPDTANDGKKYTSIVYGNGPGYRGPQERSHNGQTGKLGYRFQAAVPLPFETHSAEDTVVFARGPMAHIFSGVYEQSYVGYAMKFATCVGSDQTLCNLASAKKRSDIVLKQTNLPSTTTDFIATSDRGYNVTTSSNDNQLIRNNITMKTVVIRKTSSLTKPSRDSTSQATKLQSNALEHNFDRTSTFETSLVRSISDSPPDHKKRVFYKLIAKKLDQQLVALHLHNQETLHFQFSVLVKSLPKILPGLPTHSFKLKDLQKINQSSTNTNCIGRNKSLASCENVITILSVLGSIFCFLTAVLLVFVIRLRQTLRTFTVNKSR